MTSQNSKTLVFSTKNYDRKYLEAKATEENLSFHFAEARLTEVTASLAKGFQSVCIFTNDTANKAVLTTLAEGGTELIALRCAGYNNIDLDAAKELGITVARVPAYSPYAVAEHTIALILGLNRHLHKAYNRVRDGNFSLDGLMGFDLYQKTVGIVGTGKIGAITAGILRGFQCRVLAYDLHPNPDCEAMGVQYVDQATLFSQSDIISLHCPLMPETYHLINTETISMMKPSTMLINTSRGALIDTQAVIDGLKSGLIGSLGLDVYEEEADLFFIDRSDSVIQDDVFSRLLTFPNVLITGHQAFFTHEAMSNIAETTITNILAFSKGKPLNIVN
jgi:D-lactate dehydrogenase